jgi:hypothetical protein
LVFPLFERRDVERRQFEPFAVRPLLGEPPMPVRLNVGHRHGRSIKGGVALTSILLGFGVPMDPPTKHLIEAKEARVAGDDENGEPPDPDIARTKSSGG